MNLSDKIELFFLAFLGRTGIIDIRNLILEGKLKLSPSMAYEFSVDAMGTIHTNLTKRVVDILPPNSWKKIHYEGGRDSGKEFVSVLKGHGLIDKIDTVDNNIDKAIPLLMKTIKKDYKEIKLTSKESIYHVTKCPFLNGILKYNIPQVCMSCEGLFQGVADDTNKGSSVTIPKKMSKGDKYCEFIVKKKRASRNELTSELKLELPLDTSHEFAVREISRLLIKSGKRIKKVTTPKTYSAMLFWGARDAGREVGEMIKRFGVKTGGTAAVEAGTVFFSQSAKVKSVRVKMTEEENIGHVFFCPWSSIGIKDNVPEVCMACEGFCQGIADIMAEDCKVDIPKTIIRGNEYCKFVYRKIK
jgi:predicted hydrocarbon binding protein